MPIRRIIRKGNKMAACIITFVLLLYESVVDIYGRKIDVKAAAVVCIFNIITGIIIYKYKVYFVISGALTGVILILCAWLSRQRIGYGDGIIFIVIGMCMEPVKVIGILWGALVLAGIYGMIKIIMMKKDRNYKLPFVPFITLAYAVMFIMTLYQGRGYS